MCSFASKDMKRFNHLLGEIDAVYHRAAVGLGLSDSVMQILYTICVHGGESRCPLQDICLQTGVSKQTINSALRRLEAEGIVYLEQAGPRRKDVCLTSAGRALADRTAVRIIRAENAVLASWPREDVETYLALTERFLAGFKGETDGFAAD